MATSLHKGPEEVGDMDFPFVVEILDYWSEFPPEHLLLRAFVGFKGSEDSGRLRQKQMKDKKKLTPQEMIANSTGAKHVDCAPPHVQQAVERAKLGKHLEGPEANRG